MQIVKKRVDVDIRLRMTTCFEPRYNHREVRFSQKNIECLQAMHAFIACLASTLRVCHRVERGVYVTGVAYAMLRMKVAYSLPVIRALRGSGVSALILTIQPSSKASSLMTSG